MTERGPTSPAAAGAWVAIGAGVGAALGVAMDNIGLWLAIGVAMGAAVGLAITRSRGGS